MDQNTKIALVTGAALAAGFTFYKLFINPSNSHIKYVPTEVTTKTAKISQLYIYPVKSCSGTKVNSVELLETGAKFDREWAVLDSETGKVVTQREKPIMRQITAFVDEAKGQLVLSFARGKDSNDNNTSAVPMITVDIAKTNADMATYKKTGDKDLRSRLMQVLLLGIPGELWDEGDAVAEFLSRVIGGSDSAAEKKNYRLGRIFVHRRPGQSSNHKPITKQQDVVSMHDFSSLHVITEEGVEWVKQQAASVPNASPEPVDALRFRPNVVLSGVPFPEEDYWKKFSVGGTTSGCDIRVAKHCGRCSIPTILGDSSRDKAYFPTGDMKKNRNAYYAHQRSMEFEGKQKWPMFGLNVFHENNSTSTGNSNNKPVVIRVGDAIQVTEFATPEEQLQFQQE